MYTMLCGNNSTNSTPICGIFHPPFQSTFFAVNLVIVAITNILFAFTGTFLNSLVMYVFFKSALLRNKICYFLVAILSAIDFVVVFVVHPLSVLYAISQFTHADACTYETVYNSARDLLCSLSYYVLLAMSTERYIAVVYPYFYQQSVTRRRLFGLVAFLWCSIIGLWILVIQINSTKNIVVLCKMAFFFAPSLFFYVKIFTIARKKRRDTQHWPQSYPQLIYRLKGVKLTSTYVIVTVSLAFSLCPTLLAYGLDNLEVNRGSKAYAYLIHFKMWARTFITMNSTLNCVIFFWRNSVMRKESKKVLKTFLN